MLQIGGTGVAGVAEVLCIGAHSDDIEIGCGGTVLTLASRIAELRVTWIVLAARGERADEARRSAAGFLSQVISPQVDVESFRERYFPHIGSDLKEYFDHLGRRVSPDLIFVPAPDDRHQDHRVVAQLTLNTFRDHTIFHYEIPKYDGDLSTPNVYVALDEATLRRKTSLLMTAFESQHGREWFSEETFVSLARIRGIEAGKGARYAEGFHCRKLRFL